MHRADVCNQDVYVTPAEEELVEMAVQAYHKRQNQRPFITQRHPAPPDCDGNGHDDHNDNNDDDGGDDGGGGDDDI